MRFRFDADLWLHDSDPPWCFVTVPGDVGDEVRARTAGAPGAFGSVRVRVTIGATTWATSLFPDRARGSYLLPVKRAVREAEGVEPGDRVGVTVELAD